MTKKGDIDLWVLEPDGNVYSPGFSGTVSPNGDFTADSYPTRYLEGYQMHRFVQNGTYKFYAFLWTDPNNYGPVYTLYYRNSPTVEFQNLYSAPYPRLTTATSILSDPAPTFAKIDNNQYTDIRQVATLPIGPNLVATRSPDIVVSGGGLVEPRTSLNSASSFGASNVTPAQVQRIRALVMQPRLAHPHGTLTPGPKLDFAIPRLAK